MDVWGKWELSQETEDRLNKICSNLGSENSSSISKDWLSLLNYDSSPSDSSKMEVDMNPKVDDIPNGIKESLASNAIVSESLFLGLSVNSLSGILLSVSKLIDEFEFCTFCKNIVLWKHDILVEYSLRLVVLQKLKEFTEATGCIIFSVKELAVSKPVELCENVLIPLLSDDTFQFSDSELLSGVFSVLPNAQKDLLILTFMKKTEFLEIDWLLLYPLIKDLSQSSTLKLLECIQKFSKNFTKSQIFGRFLVNFCKCLDFNKNKDILREIVEGHETLLRIQALKYLESN